MKISQFDADWRRYLDQEMSHSEETAFLAHISESDLARLGEADRSELLTSRAAWQALGRLPRIAAPADLTKNIMAAIKPKHMDETEHSELHASSPALQALERLPRIAAPPDMAKNIMAAIKPKRQSAFARLRGWLAYRPMLGWEFAGAAMVASVLFVTIAPLSVGTLPSASRQASSPLSQVSPLSQAAHTSGPVASSLQFSLYAPEAKTVALIGDFNGWGSAAEIKLTPTGKGMWGVAVPLPAGRYQYAFLVNGQRWVTDPHAEQRVNDDFGRQNAVLTII